MTIPVSAHDRPTVKPPGTDDPNALPYDPFDLFDDSGSGRQGEARKAFFAHQWAKYAKQERAES